MRLGGTVALGEHLARQGGTEGRRLAALALVWGGRVGEADSRAVGDGRATGMERSADVEPKGRRRRRVGDQPRRPQPRSRSETARFSARRDP